MTQLSELDIRRGKLLSPETIAVLGAEVENLTETLTSIVFSADPVERETAVLCYVEAQAKRNALLALIRESFDTRASLVEMQPSTF